jgi:hypothetical protein
MRPLRRITKSDVRLRAALVVVAVVAWLLHQESWLL